MIVLDRLLPLRTSLFFHAEPDCPLARFDAALPIQPSAVAKLPPGTAESFYQAGVRRTVVISGYDDAFAEPHPGSVFQEPVTAAQVAPIASTILAFALQQLGVNATSTSLSGVTATSTSLSEVTATSTSLSGVTATSTSLSEVSPTLPAINGTYLESVLRCLAVDGSCAVLESVLGYEPDSITRRLGGVPVDKFCGVLEVQTNRRPEA